MFRSVEIVFEKPEAEQRPDSDQSFAKDLAFMNPVQDIREVYMGMDEIFPVVPKIELIEE